MARTHLKKGSSIIGDVTPEVVTVNTKGGSVTAILKQSLRGNLSAKQPYYGARIEFESGASCILVAPGENEAAESAKFRIQKLENGVMITLDDGTGELVDPVTQKVLSLYEEALKARKVKLLTQEEARARNERELKRIDSLLAKAAASS